MQNQFLNDFMKMRARMGSAPPALGSSLGGMSSPKVTLKTLIASEASPKDVKKYFKALAEKLKAESSDDSS
jgi:hypothetical protein